MCGADNVENYGVFALQQDERNSIVDKCTRTAWFLRALCNSNLTMINGAPAIAYKWDLPHSNWYFTLLDDLSGWNVHILYVGNTDSPGVHQHISWHPLSEYVVQVTGCSEDISWFYPAMETFDIVKPLRLEQIEGFKV